MPTKIYYYFNMLDILLRKLKDAILLPVAKGLGKFLTPNQISIFSFILGWGCVWFILNQNFYIALVFWILNRIFDGFDGLVARINGQQSDFGGYLDILLDFIIYAAIPIALTYQGNTIPIYLSLAILLGVYYINAVSWLYLSAILEKKKQGAEYHQELTTVTMPAGLIGGTETIIVYILFFLFPNQLPWFFLAFSALIVVGIFQRVIWATNNLKK
ncbi:MAG: CDP-alcohol phosphatidyltransferase family protein [Spirochaetes bacterium]|nr:CDP-alcohol phosphatidyltransferase family protein [Spirochaetota bacterium]